MYNTASYVHLQIKSLNTFTTEDAALTVDLHYVPKLHNNVTKYFLY